ncbi:hypothetical protein [Terricaulis sp.]|uniref:hypothetical protein n=1 Tax=Terricaulis sp. TaxID=2768686 RepID=UPI003784AFF1
MPRQIWQTASVLGLGASMLSLASLIFQGFELGVSAPIAAMLHFYEAVLSALFGWAEAPLAQLARAVGRWLGAIVRPAPEWKHLFVLVWLYFSTDARSSFMQKRTITATATLALGALVSVAAALASGGGAETGDVLLAVGVPLTGFLLHAIIESVLTTAFYREPGRSLAHSMRYYFMTEVLSAVIAGAAAIAIAVALAPSAGPSWAAIAALSGFVVVRGAYWLLRGLYIGVTNHGPEESWFRRFVRSGSGQFGMLIFSVVLGALLFVALNAGIG